METRIIQEKKALHITLSGKYNIGTICSIEELQNSELLSGIENIVIDCTAVDYIVHIGEELFQFESSLKKNLYFIINNLRIENILRFLSSCSESKKISFLNSVDEL